MKIPELLNALNDENTDVPAVLAGLSVDDLAALDAGLLKEFDKLREGAHTPEVLDSLTRLVEAHDVLAGESTRRDTEAAAAVEKVEELTRRITGESPAQPEGGDDDEDTESLGDNDEDEDTEPGGAPGETEPNHPETQPQGRELVPAAARRSVNLAAVRKSTGPPRLPARNRGTAAIVAAADLPGIPTGAPMDFDKLVAAAENRYKGFPQGHRANTQLKAAIATIERPFGKDVTQTETGDDLALMDRAADQGRLPGGSLVAAGGWCAPSETVYDLCEPETVSGLVSIPELRIRRGGLRYPVSPLFSDIYSGVGFVQTEAENIAGTHDGLAGTNLKPCYEVGCPSFTEVRLDAVGVCISAGILQQRGYPEMVARVIRGAMTAHQHKINNYVINRMAALSTPVTPALAGFGAWTDMLAALELQVVDLRYKYRLADTSAVEMVAPAWLKPILRADLTARPGSDVNSATTDAQLDAHFRARGVAVQWVLDWQDAYATGTTLGGATAATAWPTTAKVIIFPAGTFTKGVADIIQLDAIYDSMNPVKTNSYTALFSEEAILVAKRCMESRVITFTELCPAGRTGVGVAYDCTP